MFPASSFSLDLNANEATVANILGELNLTGRNSDLSPTYLIGDKSGGNPKFFSQEQAINLLDSGDYTEEYMEDDFSDLNNIIEWVEATRND